MTKAASRNQGLNFKFTDTELRTVTNEFDIGEQFLPSLQSAMAQAMLSAIMANASQSIEKPGNQGKLRDEYGPFLAAIKKAKQALEYKNSRGGKVVRNRLRHFGRPIFREQVSGSRQNVNDARPSRHRDTIYDAFMPGDEIADRLLSDLERLAKAGAKSSRKLNGPQKRAEVIAAAAVLLFFWEHHLKRSSSINDWDEKASSALKFVHEVSSFVLKRAGLKVSTQRYLRDNSADIREYIDTYLV